jgi:hypothetical protein
MAAFYAAKLSGILCLRRDDVASALATLLYERDAALARLRFETHQEESRQRREAAPAWSGSGESRTTNKRVAWEEAAREMTRSRSYPSPRERPRMKRSRHLTPRVR